MSALITTKQQGKIQMLQKLHSCFTTAKGCSRCELLKGDPHRDSGDGWAREALTEDWLFSVFHPIVDAHTGRTFAHEALLRARRPGTDEVIGAGPLIDACLRLRLEHVLDQQARRTAIRDAARHCPISRIFINFLPNTIYDPEVCLRTTVEAATQHGVALEQLVFEVVETERIPDMAHLKHILDYYRERGVGTAVDDMGAGHTSAAYLNELRPDFVKIDRAVVVAAETDRAVYARLEEMVTHARALGIRVVMEGIETLGQFQICRDAGADYLQGFLFARPACPPQHADVSAFMSRAA